MLKTEITIDAALAAQPQRSVALQWAQLIALALVHFLADVFPGMMHSVLPTIQSEFVLSVTLGGVLLGAFNFACNWVQVATGQLRANSTRPLFMYLGLMFAAMICLLAVLPRTASSFPWMVVLAVACGCGVAIIHPEALRAVHALDRIAPATSTTVFMVGGMLGFALGGKYSTELVSFFGGVQGLFPLAVCPVVCILALIFLNVPLAVEHRSAGPSANAGVPPLPFWPILTMATLAGVSTSVVVWIAPQRLEELGFELTFGGFSVMMFSLGAGIGSFFWAAVARRISHVGCALVSVLLGVPLIIAYAITVKYRAAVWLLFAASFCGFGSYPLVVAMARSARGPGLGHRMGLVVGGTWGITSLILMALAPVADIFGKQAILFWSWTGYAVASAAGLYLLRYLRRTARLTESAPTCQ